MEDEEEEKEEQPKSDIGLFSKKLERYFFEKRAEQNQYWMLETINEYLKNHFYNHPEIVPLLKKNKEAVANNTLSPFAAAQDILDTYFKK